MEISIAIIIAGKSLALHCTWSDGTCQWSLSNQISRAKKMWFSQNHAFENAIIRNNILEKR